MGETNVTSPLYELLDIDAADVVEKQCGMLHCTGPALRDIDQWLDLDATASKKGEVVAEAEVTVPLCAPHRLTWEVFFDAVPDDILTPLLGALVDFERYPLDQRIVDSFTQQADAEGDTEEPA